MAASIDSPPRPGAPEWRVAMAGVLVIAVSYGFARYGYGLFLPQIRSEFALSTSTLGLIGSATYVGYLTALVLVGVLAARVGPRPLILCAGLSATIGMALVAIAPGPGVLVAGLVLAGTSSGWAWAPYSDVVDRLVRPERRQRVMALLPAGTAFGVVVSGPLALVAHDAGWRYAWLLFAAVALAATVSSARTLPRGADRPVADGSGGGVGWRWLLRPRTTPLYVSAAAYGVVGSVYWTFAIDAISRAGSADAAVAPLFWTLVGLAGTAGVFTGTLLARLGLGRSHGLLFGSIASAVLLLGLAPGTPVVGAVSAVLYGPSFMAVSGLLAVWSYRLFPDRPAAGLSATVFFLGLGTIVGPAVLGIVADHHGLRLAFVLTAGLAALALAARPTAVRA
jgi:predicted MFS family arabinose efflux permease